MTSDTTGSFTYFNYLLRPSKQVERKLVIEALHRLAVRGYDIPHYKYIGFGSPYYADFILFHKHLYIGEMLCVEKKNIERRMRLNKPWEFIQLHMGPVSEVLPKIDPTRPHLLWLDYESPLDISILSDLSNALKVLSPGSVFLITVKAEFSDLERAETLEAMKVRRDKLVGEYQELLGRLIPDGIKPAMVARNNLPALFSQAMSALIHETVGTRQDADLEFAQIFNYRYADGAVMLSFGGLIDTPEKIEVLKNSGYFAGEFAVTDLAPKRITVPPLTVREKNWLDQNLVTARDGKVEEHFELDLEAQKSYFQFYQYYPTFFESLI